MNSDSVKDAVREQYGTLARTTGSCCGPSCGCSTDESALAAITMNDPYAGDEASIVATADMGLGCGTPGAFADLREGMTVLDLGCGAGIDVFLAARAVGSTGKAIGVDMTDAMLERALLNKSKLGMQNAEFRKGEIEHLPVDSGSVDRVISNCVINLVPDKSKAFSEIHRVLRPGGSFTVSDVVSIGTITDDVRDDMSLWTGCVAGALEKHEYLRLIREAGFKDVAVASEKAYTLEEDRPFGLQSITVRGTK
jgi:arsenite methyltransferase